MEPGDMLDNLSMVGEHLGRRSGAEQTYIDLSLTFVERKPDTILDASTRGEEPYQVHGLLEQCLDIYLFSRGGRSGLCVGSGAISIGCAGARDVIEWVEPRRGDRGME